GVRAYPSVGDLPEVPELVVVATPAKTVPAIVKDCGERGVRGMIVISAGFKETGPEGVELERQVLSAAREHRIRLVGPNCLGVMNPTTGLNATFSKGVARPGHVAFISQSGALCTAVLDWSHRENVGFSAFVSTGSMLDVGFGDLIDYLGNDPRTRSILVYMETVGDARRFLSAAREVALNKPIICIKPGRSEAAAKAAASHTGSLVGSDDVLDAAFRRVGVLRVNQISDLFHMAEVLAKQPVPKGPRMTIVTNAGGPAVIATDALVQNGARLADVGDEAMDKLNEFLPPAWSHNNPIDVLGDAPADRYAKTLELAAEDPESDGLLVVLTPQDMTEPTETAELLLKHVKGKDRGGKGGVGIGGTKPLLASWMGGPFVQGGVEVLNRMGVPTFDYPDTAARMFAYMHRYANNLLSLYETPQGTGDDEKDARQRAEAIIDEARNEGRETLTEEESKRLLSAYDIPTVETVVATSTDAAAQAADRIGYPVVVKLHSKTITHKTDVGGVQLNLPDADAVRDAFTTMQSNVDKNDFLGVTVQPMVRMSEAYELILGSSPDPQFGPTLLFGSGGTLVEVFKDKAVGLPPLTTTFARRMMERTKIAEALKGVRGRRAVDIAGLEKLLVRFSRLVAELRFVKEIDINPLLASPDGLVALDARVIVYPAEVKRSEITPPAIRPYPTRYVNTWSASDGTSYTVRPIKPEDEPLMVQFHEELSEESVRMRYFELLRLDQRTAHERLTRICFNDYSREIALVAVDATGKAAGVGRLSKVPGFAEAEFAVTVTDPHQGRGLGTKLLGDLLNVAKVEGWSTVVGIISPANGSMLKVAKNLGFSLEHDEEEGVMRATYVA
ncbi:MAG: bifunctional acetate--CoA ligase family protein/GNAT family N-acetyltransferase, partial [Planctomycetota bacterium]